jgi:O-antigen/teichoic acid export membrane protein
MPTPDETAEGAAFTSGEVATLAGNSAALLFVRRIFLQAVSVLSTAFVAREIGVGNFGELASAQGLLGLFQALVDFGFSLVVARELARHRRPGHWLGAALVSEGVLGITFSAILGGIALVSGITSVRGTILLVLVPSLAVAGISPMRQVFLVTYRVRDLAKIDVTTNLSQSLLTILIVLAGGGVVAVAVIFTVTSVLNTVWVSQSARRFTELRRPDRSDVRALLHAALPIGLVSFMASVYFTIDLVILPYLVRSHAVGDYAAAIKILNLLATVPGLVMTAALPGMASLRHTREGLGELAARIAHWLAAFALPGCVGAIVFAPTIVKLCFGSQYDASVPLLRVLSIAAALTALSALLGTLLTSQAVWRIQLIQNSIAMTVNIGGNVLFAPRFGPIASAWLTVLTEIIVDTGSLIALRSRITLKPAMVSVVRPAIACAVLPVFAFALGRWPYLALPVAGLGYLVALILLGAWPTELSFKRLRVD